MIREIIDTLLPNLISLNYTDTVAGCVATIVRNEKGANGKMTVQKFPAYYNADKSICNNYSDYIDLVPNSAKKSILYFEEYGNQFLKQDAYYYHVRSNVRLIFWCNLKKINKDFISAEPLKLNLIKSIPQQIPNIDNKFSFIRVNFQSENIKNADIFSKYTYDETIRQHLLFPFDYFSLNYSIEYQVSKNCIEEITINPEPC